MVRLLLSAVLASAPTEQKPPKPTPEERLAKADEGRVALHLGLRGYSRYLDAPTTLGGSIQLGFGIRLVRGLYLASEIGGGAHGMPFGAAGQLFIGLRHEFRFAKWLRPNISFGYSHLIDAELDAEFVRNEHDDDDHHHDHDHWHDDHHDDHHDVDYGDGYRIVHNSDAKITQRPGVQAGLGLALPLEFAPRLSFYVQGDVAYYFDRAPGRLQAGGGFGFKVVF